LRDVLYLLFPLLCIGAIDSRGRRSPLAERVVFGLALYEFLLFAIGMTLGMLGQLTPGTYVALTVGTALGLLVKTVRNGGCGIDVRTLQCWMRTRRGMVAILIAALVAATFSMEMVFDFFHGTQHYDGLWYHIPRMIFWRQQGSFGAWATPVWAQIGLPVGAEVVLGQKVFLGGGWAGVGLVTGVLSVGAAFCVYLGGLDLGLTRWSALMAALLFSSFPVIGERYWTVSSDMVAAFPILAAYVALNRMRDHRFAVASFILLNCIAVACKPTVAPHALVLGLVALWRCRQRVRSISPLLTIAAGAVGVFVVLASYWPVHGAFHDFQGGEKGRGHKVASAGEFAQAVSLNTAHWILDPLGYTAEAGLTPKGQVERFYRSFGATFTGLPDGWMPSPNQDVGRTGLAAVIFLPLLVVGLPRRSRLLAGALMVLAFVAGSGMVHFQPWAARYTIVLLAGYSLIWCGTRFFRRGSWRWILVLVVGANVGALLGVTTLIVYRAHAGHSAASGYYNYVSAPDRHLLATDLGERPLLVVASESLDALLVGPAIDYKMQYVVCPSDGDWSKAFQMAANHSKWLAVVHRGRRSMVAGPDYSREGQRRCSEIPISEIEKALISAGWARYRQSDQVNLWAWRPNPASPPTYVTSPPR
jgi:hypothetical protein